MRILVVEDERKVAAFIRQGLVEEGHAVEVAADGAAALDAIAEDPAYDLVVLDVMLPKRDGFNVLKTLRDRHVQTPVLLLTARDGVADKVAGLDLGADDYLTKPFSLRELAARVSALLRRVEWERGTPGGIYRDSRLTVDPARVQVVRNGAEVHLTRREFAVLWHLISLCGRVASREQILDAVWGLASSVDARTVDAHIRTLRRKLGEDVIETLIGSGYRFRSRP